MSAASDELAAQLESLRRDFDRSFSVAASPRETGGEHLLAIRVGRDPYALRTQEIAMIDTDRPITEVPSSSPELIGVAGLRGALVAVYDLAALIGLPRSEAVRWLVLCKGTDLAFAFAALDGHVRATPADLSRSGSGSSELLAEVARIGGVARPIIELSTLVSQLERRQLHLLGDTGRRSSRAEEEHSS
jgi:chemotaxis signal transduction protein